MTFSCILSSFFPLEDSFVWIFVSKIAHFVWWGGREWEADGCAEMITFFQIHAILKSSLALRLRIALMQGMTGDRSPYSTLWRTRRRRKRGLSAWINSPFSPQFLAVWSGFFSQFFSHDKWHILFLSLYSITASLCDWLVDFDDCLLLNVSLLFFEFSTLLSKYLQSIV